MIDVRRSADVRLMVGASGSGKSSWLKASLSIDRPRVLIFDPEGEYAGHIPRGAAHAYDLTAGQAWRVRVVPPADRAAQIHAFGWFCRLALARAPCVVAVDELHLVTDAWRPPAEWVSLVTRARKYGISIYAAAPRLTVVDKTVENTVTAVRAGRLNYDRKRAADLLAVPEDDVAQLTGTQWIERDMLTGKVTRGEMWPSKGRSRPTGRPKSA